MISFYGGRLTVRRLSQFRSILDSGAGIPVHEMTSWYVQKHKMGDQWTDHKSDTCSSTTPGIIKMLQNHLQASNRRAVFKTNLLFLP